VLVSLLAVGAGRRAILRLISEALVIPAEIRRGVVPRGRSGERAAALGAGATVCGAAATIAGTGATVPGAVVTISGTGATVPFSAEGLHPAGQVLYLLHECGVGWCANARELRPGDGLGYAVGTACCGVKLDIVLGGEGDLYVPG
jgi:hypothetical protein